ncbi:Transcriptional regulatory protein DegU [Pontiella desulfatans]|uniref:Transcriptional regulatory protein DegU n=1 Tax=Pontiella desulfatans TaxID=2750659 RepID=A0A6C2U0F9_PONDE|nr:response regulator transcription factor [Pontiella desulfatans]VGO13440.1 Transcriptional regulatory protein DegU [Pontiella desulfatans]
MSEAVTIAIVDDHKSTRELIADLVRDESRFECVGLFPDFDAAIKGLPNLKPSIVLMDINLPGKNGIECVQELKPLMPDTDFVILTAYDQTDYIFKALSSGAVGYLLKRSIVSELIPSLEEVAAGGSPMDSDIARKVVQSFTRGGNETSQSDEFSTLSGREMEVLSRLARGRLCKEIADELDISVNTVNTYLRRIYEKLQVHSRAEAVAKFTGIE